MNEAETKFESGAVMNGWVSMWKILEEVFSVRVNVAGFGRLKFFVF